MRKLTVLAVLAAVIVAAPMFGVSRHLTKTPDATFAFGGGAAFGPTTTNNNDSCDIGDTPAATLLLPFFDVDFANGTRNTIFSIVNTSPEPQIAHVVLWTDWSFAALDFNVFLTGYDVQSISLRDIFANGVIAPNAGNTASGTSITGSVNGPGTSPTIPTVDAANVSNGAPGAQPFDNVVGNPNFTTAAANCINLPGQIPPQLLTDLRVIFTTGAAGAIIGNGCGSVRLGGVHADAIGYVTIDVASNCTTNLPGPTYFTGDILFDNTLTGDYEDLFLASGALANASGGSPLVHIRAIPEGGPAGSAPGTNLPFTFYDRYTGFATQAGRTFDRRQPLPSTFAARWIQGGTGGFNTNFQIWREGLGALTGSSTTCSNAANVPAGNSALLITDEVRFDEHENAVGTSITGNISPTVNTNPTLPETSSTPTQNSLPFPAAVPGSTDVGGWMYLNLTNGGTGANDFRLTAQRVGFGPTLGNRTTTQNWVVVNMQAAPTFAALFDATWLGNGCTPAPLRNAVIAPANQRPTGLADCPPPLVIGTTCPAGTQVNPSTP